MIHSQALLHAGNFHFREETGIISGEDDTRAEFILLMLRKVPFALGITGRDYLRIFWTHY